MWNIIGDQNWKNASVRVVLFAHWDSRPTAEEDRDVDNRHSPIPGANDGASGVAVLLELARVLKDALPPTVGVEYVMTDGEDLGPGEDEMYLGADVYAKGIATMPKANYGILLDMIGQKDLAVPKEVNSIRYANRLMTALYDHAAKVGLASAFPSVVGEEIDDDHLPMIKAGLPTIDLIEFSGYMPFWHTLQDTPDKCSADSLGKVGKLLQTWLQKPTPFTNGG
jgi:Zn-dependent M28 family amino/carboxypeptidase